MPIQLYIPLLLQSCLSLFFAIEMSIKHIQCIYCCLERPPHWPQKCSLSRQVVSSDRFSYIEI